MKLILYIVVIIDIDKWTLIVHHAALWGGRGGWESGEYEVPPSDGSCSEGQPLLPPSHLPQNEREMSQRLDCCSVTEENVTFDGEWKD